MAIDLLKLEKRFIDLLENTTQEEFEQWLLTKTKPMAQQKTAMEQWIQWYENATNYEKDNYSHKKAKKLLGVEKEQLHKCASFWRGKECEIEKQIFDQYYTQTYSTRLQNETNCK